MKFLAPQTDRLYALMRIVVGFLFMCHGLQKVLGLLGGAQGSGEGVQLASLIGLAGLIELVGGAFVMIGFFARPAAFLASGLMAVGYFMAHFPQGFWPIQNGGELAAVYAWVFLFIAARGNGTWSVTSVVKS